MEEQTMVPNNADSEPIAHDDDVMPGDDAQRDAHAHKQRTAEDDLYELISPSSAVLSSYTHDEGEGLHAIN